MLAFWMKACVHIAFELDFGESVGAFNGSPQGWDDGLLVGMWAMAAAIFFRLGQIYMLRQRRISLKVYPDTMYAPAWYVNYGRWVWCFSLVIILCVALVNFTWGIFQIGMLPNILPFKLNALIAAALNLLFPLWMATLIWWDVCLKKPFLLRFIGAVFEAIIGSVSILSRGAYVYHTLHYLVSSSLNWKALHLSRLGYIGVLIIIALGTVGTSLLTTNVRTSLYATTTQQLTTQQLTTQQEITQKNLEKYKVQQKNVIWHNDFYQVMISKGLSNATSRMLTLLVDRWIGLEGILAVSAYDQTGRELFVNGWMEKTTLSTKVVFNYISNSIYIDSKNIGAEGFLFSSIPGLVAMLYYSGSYLIVFVGVILLFLLVGLLEYFVFLMVKNPFIFSFLGIYMANMLAQFSTLHQLLIQLIEITLILSLVAWLQPNRNQEDKCKSDGGCLEEAT